MGFIFKTKYEKICMNKTFIRKMVCQYIYETSFDTNMSITEVGENVVLAYNLKGIEKPLTMVLRFNWSSSEMFNYGILGEAKKHLWGLFYEPKYLDSYTQFNLENKGNAYNEATKNEDKTKIMYAKLNNLLYSEIPRLLRASNPDLRE